MTEAVGDQARTYGFGAREDEAMPGKMTVDPEQLEQTADDLNGSVTELQSQLDLVQGKVDALLDDGYQTPTAQQKFRPMHDDYVTKARQLKENLSSISQFLKQVGVGFTDTDTTQGSNLGS